jgi:hypothetical protein
LLSGLGGALVALALPAGCTHPPAATTVASAGAEAGGGSAAGCDGPPVVDEPAGCVDDAARPPNARPAARPGDDRDGDGVEDLLDVCPDEAAAVDGDGDGCADRPGS